MAALHPQVRAFLDARNQTDLGIDYRRISAPELRAGFADLAGVAPATIFTAEYDVLRDEGEAYGVALRRAGVSTHCKRWNGHIRDFTLMAEHIADAETALREAGEALRLALQAE
ncbi:alpha/beta hydrolase [Xanthomonas arboricola pv. corylina]|uniref:alpha/beta hydrolase n=1 Tax=Xanthomonas arboricola TaxID=56448 RepID=UPI00404082BD